MKTLLLAGVALVLASTGAAATQIIAFGQTSPNNTLTATVNGAATQTTIVTSAPGASVLIDQLFGAVTPPAIPGIFSMTATSIDAAQTVLGAVIQHYSGSFCISSITGCSGVIDLQGTFSDAAFGLNGGTQLSVNVANPPDTLSLNSSVIPLADLIAPNSFTLSLSNLAALSISGTTIAPFTASFSGVANATTVAAAEPLPLAVLGVGILGLAMVKRRSH